MPRMRFARRAVLSPRLFGKAVTMSPPEFPAGPYTPEPNMTAGRRAELIAEIEQLPTRIRELVANASAAQLETRYKNWTVRQIVHHLADSHLQGFVRFRLTLTEDRPTIKTYDPTRWSELADSKT